MRTLECLQRTPPAPQKRKKKRYRPQQKGLEGQRLASALVEGCEVAVQRARVLHPALRRQHLHPHPRLSSSSPEIATASPWPEAQLRVWPQSNTGTGGRRRRWYPTMTRTDISIADEG
eukprot:3833084-Rhodomonas_salina.3